MDPKTTPLRWGVMATGPHGRLAWRLWIPIHVNGQVVSWTTRAIGDHVRPRYVSASPEEEIVSHKSVLYGEDLAGPTIVIVEGPLDVWAIGPGAVGVLGLQVTPEQINRMGRYPLRVLCFDNEPAAQRRASRLADLLASFPGDTDIDRLETGDDPADAEKEEIEELRKRYF